MTWILNTREDFAAQSLAGFVSANAGRGPSTMATATARFSEITGEGWTRWSMS